MGVVTPIDHHGRSCPREKGLVALDHMERCREPDDLSLAPGLGCDRFFLNEALL
jgi:hypothetical protein